LQTEITHWKTRLQKLLDQYQRVDPEAHNKLVEEHTTLSNSMNQIQRELEKMQQINMEVQKKVTDLEQQLQAKTSEFALLEQKDKKLRTHCAHWKNECNKVTKQVQEVQEQLDKETKNREELLQKNLLQQVNLTKLEEERKRIDEELVAEKMKVAKQQKLLRQSILKIQRTKNQENRGVVEQRPEEPKSPLEVQDNQQLSKDEITFVAPPSEVEHVNTSMESEAFPVPKKQKTSTDVFPVEPMPSAEHQVIATQEAIVKSTAEIDKENIDEQSSARTRPFGSQAPSVGQKRKLTIQGKKDAIGKPKKSVAAAEAFLEEMSGQLEEQTTEMQTLHSEMPEKLDTDF